MNILGFAPQPNLRSRDTSPYEDFGFQPNLPIYTSLHEVVGFRASTQPTNLHFTGSLSYISGLNAS